jgi:hypothetical protein
MPEIEELPNLSETPPSGTVPGFDAETASELDKLLLEATDGKGEDLPIDGPPADPKPPEVKPDVEPKPDAVVPPAVTPEPDELDKVELPTNIKPKTGEAFAKVKEVARERIGSLVTRTKELETKLAEVESRFKDGGLTPELKKELDDLRGFRAKLDVEADPAFKEYDSKVTQTTESIYARLIAGGAAPEVVEKIKSMGGINAIEWDPLLEKLAPTIRRFIEAKLVEIEDIGERKATALKDAKENAQKYIQERQEKVSKSQETSNQQARQHGEKLLADTAWMKPKEISANATPEQKKEAEGYNAFLKEAAQAVAEASANDSPEMRAVLGLGVAELMKTRRDFDAYKAQTEAQVQKLTKDLKESTDLLEKIKKGSTQRLRNSSANEEPGSKNAGSFEEHGGEAIDRMAKEAAAGERPM